MPTKRQIAANRLNAQKSTGPRTEQGRAAVRLNAVTHGLCARTIVLPGEDESEFLALCDDLAETYQPANRAEAILVRTMAIASWYLDRAFHIEGAVLQYELEDDEKLREKYHPGLDLYGKLAYLMQESSNGRKLSTLVRYQAHHHRIFNQALRNLERLQSQRKAEERKTDQHQTDQHRSSVRDQFCQELMRTFHYFI